MTQKDEGRLRFAHFTSFDPGGPPGALWSHPSQRAFDYRNLSHWVDLARTLEAARFDCIFWADHSSVHDVYLGSWKPTVREAVQFPLLDPLMLTAALASATQHLGFAFSANVIQDHPYPFARRLATLDHLTEGRIGWNIVTSFQPSAWRNLGHDKVDDHHDRYERADEFVEVIYKLLDGSWDDDAVIRDIESKVYADPERVHEIQHQGKYYRVPGIAPSEPSPQRLPVLFQAGSSDDGRAFSAKHAEAVFFAPYGKDGAKAHIDDMKSRALAAGRSPEDILYFLFLPLVVGSTDEEAQRLDRETQDYLSSETNLTFMSSTLGTDIGAVDVDTPIGDLQTNALQGMLKAIAESAPDASWTFRQLVMSLTQNRLVGGPETIADELEQWRDIGVRGLNVGSITGVADMSIWPEHISPILQQQGLMQKEYRDGTFREKLFDTDDPRVPASHPGASHRARVVMS